MAIHFPDGTKQEKVEAGREPRGQTVISFYADPSIDPQEQEKIIAATTVLDIALRDILREDLGRPTRQVGLSPSLPQRGSGHIQVRFQADPQNLPSMSARVMQEIKRLQAEGPSKDLTDRAKETARRGYETALKQNDYWLGRLQTIKTYNRDPGEILTRVQRIETITPQVLQSVFKQYFPMDRSTTVTLIPAPTQG